MAKEPGASPVGGRLLVVGRREARALAASLAEREQRGQAEWGGPARVTSVDDDLCVCGYGCELFHHLLERVIVQRRWHCDDAGHVRLSSPRRWDASPVTPRCPTLRAAASPAAFIASANLSPATIREK